MAQPRIPDQLARAFVVDRAHGQLRHLTLETNRAIKYCSADAVHDVRVAIRRFMQAIAVCRTYFSAAEMPKNRRQKKIMDAAGEVRNRDIALKMVARFRTPNAAHLRSKLQDSRKESTDLLVGELRKWRDRRMSAKWHAALKADPAPRKNASSGEAADELAHRVLGRIAKDFLKQGNAASSAGASPKVLHHFRIAAKKFRYALEMFQPLYGTSLNSIIESIKDASALLGDVNDCVTVSEIVAGYKGGNALADRLKKRQHKKTEEFRQCWKKEFSDAGLLLNSINGVNKKPAASSRTISERHSKSAA